MALDGTTTNDRTHNIQPHVRVVHLGRRRKLTRFIPFSYGLARLRKLPWPKAIVHEAESFGEALSSKAVGQHRHGCSRAKLLSIVALVLL